MRRLFRRKKAPEPLITATLPIEEKPLPPLQGESLAPSPPQKALAALRPDHHWASRASNGGSSDGSYKRSQSRTIGALDAAGVRIQDASGQQNHSVDEADGSRERRQVAFVSPPVSPVATTTPAPPRPPSPSLPALSRSLSPGMGPTGTIRAGNTFHHPPASVGGPSSAYKSATSVWKEDVTASVNGSCIGHGNRSAGADTNEQSVTTPDLRSTSPMSFASSRRGSGGVGPADTWGGNIIGGRLGDDFFQPMTWSEMTELDLVENLSGRERTRQEVLWEIVASEERYVGELIALKENYVDPLLHPLRSPTPSPGFSQAVFASASDFTGRSTPSANPDAAFASDVLPIASRFARTTSQSSRTSSVSKHTRDYIPDIDSEDTHNDNFNTRSTIQGTTLIGDSITHTLGMDSSGSASGHGANMNTTRSKFPKAFGTLTESSSHSSLLRNGGQGGPVADEEEGGILAKTRKVRHYLKPPPPPNKLHKNGMSKDVTSSGRSQAPIEIPNSLKIVLEIIGENLLRGHKDLSVKLKEKYLEQFPLVRDLTSVWAEQTWIIQQYNVYVLHLERALSEVDQVLTRAGGTKEEKRLGKYIMRLEEAATSRGECGLAICLSKPFQRLLKYPLLFQNLLYHTDASTHEYESAQSMAISIDTLVRSIEDEKVDEDERDRARDVWARIDRVDDKQLMIPRSGRLLIDEESVWKPIAGKERRTFSDAPPNRTKSPEVPPKDQPTKAERLRIIKGQKSFRRLSDMVSGNNSDNKEPTLGSKRDIWLIVFSDVVLRCQRTGVTRLSSTTLTKEAKKGRRRSIPGRERNLYRFLQVEKWQEYVGPKRRGSLSVRNREDAEEEHLGQALNSPVRERKDSQMSFCYDLDEPKPAENTVGKSSGMSSSTGNVDNGTRPDRLASQATQAVLAKRTPAVAKFSNRVTQNGGLVATPLSLSRPSSAMSHPRQPYEAPTTSSLAKTRAGTSRPTSPPPVSRQNRRRTGSASGGGGSLPAPINATRKTGPGGLSPPVISSSSSSRPSTPITPCSNVLTPVAKGKDVDLNSSVTSEDFSAFRSYYDTPPGSAIGIGFTKS